MTRLGGHVTIAMTALALSAGGCDRVPLGAPPVEAGAGTRVALAVIQHAQQVAATPEPAFRGCHLALPPNGPLRVDTTLTYVLVDDDRTQRWQEVRGWRRDRVGNLALQVTLDGTLPDGRATDRRQETRWIGDAAYVALDERFVVAPEPLAAAAPRHAVDTLLAQLRWDDGWHAATADRAFCAGRLASELPRELDAQVRWEALDRRGWIRWGRAGERQLTVHFDERVQLGADPVEAPTTLWDIAADPSIGEVEGFVSEGLEAGWLLTPRQPYGEHTASSP